MGPRYGGLCVPPLLFALFLGTFAIGTTEFAIVGLLPDIAESLGVSVSATGLLVSGYALGVAVGGPAVVATTTVTSAKVSRSEVQNSGVDLFARPRRVRPFRSLLD
jgi:hypothetical protein